MIVHACEPRTREVKTGGHLGLLLISSARLAESVRVGSGLSENLVTESKVEAGKEDAGHTYMDLRSSLNHTHICAHMWTHT